MASSTNIDEPNHRNGTNCGANRKTGKNVKKQNQNLKQNSTTTSTSARFTRPSLFDRTSFFGKIWFCYVYPLFVKGARKNGLDFDDLHRCSTDDEAEKLMLRLSKVWRIESKKEHPKFWCALLRSISTSIILPLIILLFVECFLNIVQPLLLGQVIQYFNGTNSINYRAACVAAAGICLTTAVNITLIHPTMVYMSRLGMRTRIACATLMYRKSLKLNRAALSQTTVGQVINIMSNDSMRFDEFGFFSTYLITGPAQMVIVVNIVWSYLGPSCLSGLAILLLFIPFQSLMGRLFSGIRIKTALLTDARLRYMTEIISGMRVIKMYNWERPFAERVEDARRKEVSKIRRACFLKALNLSMFFVASRLIMFVCFVVYVLLGNTLTSEAVFVTMSLLNTLRLTMTLFFPFAISGAAELKITCQRIQEFLLLEEMSTNYHVTGGMETGNESDEKEELLKPSNENSGHHNDHKNNDDRQCFVNVTNITANWIKPKPKINKSTSSTLKNISLDLKPGELLAVIGPVGSGKSSFLMSLLKELPIESGQIDVRGTISYSSQDAWSFNETMRNNILFGAEYDPDRYRQVVHVCALERDIALMQFGDRTFVGERGVALSGGQKARINLARAIYRNANIFLLDDPLSAVDAAVAQHIFDKCIFEYLKSKIRILVTHQIQFIEKADKVLILNNGECLAYGTYADIQSQGINFVSLLSSTNQDKSTGGENLTVSAKEAAERSISRLSMDSLNVKRDIRTPILRLESDESKRRSKTIDSKAEEEARLLQIEEEQLQHGSISGRTYGEYIRAGTGPIMLLSMLVFTVISQVTLNGVDIFLTKWTNTNQQRLTQTSEIIDKEPQRSWSSMIDNLFADQRWVIVTYSLLTITLFSSSVLRAITFFSICMRASVRLHNKIFERLLRAPIAFFDTNPAGRILNRFTKDLGIIDEMLPFVAYDLNLIALQAIGIVGTVAYVNWYLIFPAILLTIIMILVRGIYIKSARDIKRFEGLTRSPVFSHVSTTFNGLASIRAYGAQRTFEKQFFTYQNDHTATWFLFLSSSRGVGLIVDWICIIFNVIIIVSVMLAKDMPGGDAGLAISSGLLLAGMSQWGVRQSAEFENEMISVERIVEYQDLPQEASSKSLVKSQNEPKPQWAMSGEIVFDHMNLAYGETRVLKDINCVIFGGEKIGIVGRTGAGKSSIIAALFRLTEPIGLIRIDGVDIQSMDLNDLRRKISIIPQDPVVFIGTIRYNLDPFNEYSDQELWSALEEVQLKTQVNNFNEKLETKLSESGGNLSVGQRQLICLARAILRRNHILVLDEATANVDHQTDSLIQATIRTKFAQCTVLTVAHRLNTIIDCDRVLVLDGGKVLEFDSPYLLLKKRGKFYEMVKKTGTSMFSHLYQTAKRSYICKQSSLKEDDILCKTNQEDKNNEDEDDFDEGDIDNDFDTMLDDEIDETKR